MTSDQSVDERIRRGVLEVTADELPDRVLQATFEQTRTVRQRRGLSGWRLTKMIRINRSMFVVGAAAIALVAIVGVALLPRLGSLIGTGEPTGQIAFERTVEGNTDIYLINLDGTGLVRLTDDPLPDHGSAWSPDGGTLFFSRQIRQDEASDIYSLDIESGNATQLTDDPGIESSPKVSPDGSQIAFDVWPSEPGIYVMNVDGSNKRQAFALPDDTYVLVGWTADGAGIYLIRNGNEILRVDVASGAVSPVARGGQEEMSVSPDGRTFAFMGDSQATPDGIFLMDVDGTNVTKVPGSEAKNGRPTWSPDGQRLAFDTEGWIYIVPVTGGAPTQLTEGDSATWRPVP